MSNVKSLDWLKHLNHAPGTPDYFRSLAGCLMIFPDEIWISEENLATLMGKSDRSIRSALKWGFDNGWLRLISLGSDFGRQAVASKYVREIPEHAAHVWIGGELALVDSCMEHRKTASADLKNTGSSLQDHRKSVAGTPEVHCTNTGSQLPPKRTYEESLGRELNYIAEPGGSAASKPVRAEGSLDERSESRGGASTSLLALENAPVADHRKNSSGVKYLSVDYPKTSSDTMSQPKREPKRLTHKTKAQKDAEWAEQTVIDAEKYLAEILAGK